LKAMNGIKLDFPNKSIPNDINITCKMPSVAQYDNDTEEVSFGGNIITAAKFEVSVDGSVISPYYFDKPIEVTIPFNGDFVRDSGIDPLKLRIYFVTSTGELDEAGISDVVVDTVQNTVTGMVAHFSELAVAPIPEFGT